jgi:2-(1,2-epoxy-1,2-dihydrophenyl)acetyl-CoA isomerase
MIKGPDATGMEVLLGYETPKRMPGTQHGGIDLAAVTPLIKADDVNVTVHHRNRGVHVFERALHERYHPVITGLRELPKPVVSAVQGPCVGVGLSLALCADLVYAVPSAYFLLAFVNIGLVPDGGSSAFIPARIGFTRAAEMAMLGERVEATKAESWGLINGVIDEDSFDLEMTELASKLADGPTLSYAGSKRQLNSWSYRLLGEQLGLEASVQQEMAESADFTEGVLAFIEKREASFGGA